MSHFSRLILIVAPSGTGKTSIVRHLLANFSDLSFSISATTRRPRAGEINGRDYYFIDEEDFRNRINEDAFLEWQMVYEGIYYGTLLSELARISQINKVPLLEIDVFGAIDIIKRYARAVYGIFLEPPSMEALQARLIARGTDSPAMIDDRLKKAKSELEAYDSALFQERIINDDLELCKQEISQKIRAYLNQSQNFSCE